MDTRKIYLGVTDNKWFNYLSQINPEDVNFWKPGGKIVFSKLLPDEPFLFKFKEPINAIGGVAFFSSFTKLPLSMAWEIFAERNGCSNFETFKRMIQNYRKDGEENPVIGCIVLTNPVFFKRED